MEGPNGRRRRAASLARHERLIGPGAALLLGAATAFFLHAMPPRILSRLIDMTGLPPAVAGARGALALGVAAVVGGATWALFRLFDRAPAPRTPPLAITHVAAPVLRRADAHPDAPACRPIFAGSDLGPPLDRADWRIAAGEGFDTLDTLELTEVVDDPSPTDPADAGGAIPVAPPPDAAVALPAPATIKAPGLAGEASSPTHWTGEAARGAPTDRVDAPSPTSADETGGVDDIGASGSGGAAIAASNGVVEVPLPVGADHGHAHPVPPMAVEPVAGEAIVQPAPAKPLSAPFLDTTPGAAASGAKVADADAPPAAVPPPLTAGMARLETALARKALALDGDAANVTALRREIRPIEGSLRAAVAAIEQRVGLR